MENFDYDDLAGQEGIDDGDELRGLVMSKEKTDLYKKLDQYKSDWKEVD